MFVQAIEDILIDRCTPAMVRAIEGGAPPVPLWRAVADAGFLDLLRPEEEGGAGLPLGELFPVLQALGRHALPLPLADAMGARALMAPGTELPTGLLALAPALVRQPDGSWQAPLVPRGAVAQYVLANDDGQLVLLITASASRVPSGIAGSLSVTLTWPTDHDLVRVQGDGRELAPLAAALQAAVMTGTMARVFEMTLEYCNQRQQFGRPLGKFQAVQHQLAAMAEQVAAATLAAEAAFQADGRVPRLLPAAIAKARTSEAAPLIANIAHGLHGAIGITEEYDLQLFTRRLHEGRMACGADSYWNRIVGEQLLAGDQTLAEFVRST